MIEGVRREKRAELILKKKRLSWLLETSEHCFFWEFHFGFAKVYMIPELGDFTSSISRLGKVDKRKRMNKRIETREEQNGL